MFVFIITIHVITCSLLILIVLVQQGKGGGLLDSLSSAESIFGTKTNTFLIKATSVLAVVFFISCLSLALLSVRKNKSLIETSYKPASETQAPAPEDTAVNTPTPQETNKPAEETPAQVTTQTEQNANTADAQQPASANTPVE